MDIGLTVIADLAKINDDVKAEAEAIYENTFVQAQKYNLQMRKEVGPTYLPQCHYGDQWPLFPRTTGFLNE